MRGAITLVALVFTSLMAFATIYVLLKHGPDIFTLFGVLIVLLFATGIFGALSETDEGGRRRKRRR
jgi:uncharacterized membrane protein